MHDPRHNRPFAQNLPLYPFADRWQKDRFLELVRTHLGRDGQTVRIKDGFAFVDGSPTAHGLCNLAQICNQAPGERWATIIAEHLGKSDVPKLRALVGNLLGDDYEQHADQLIVRIYPTDFLAGGLHQHLVHRQDLPATCSVLALDIGPSILPVPAPIAARWNRPSTELFERALQNLPRFGMPRWTRLPLPANGSWVDLLHGEFHTASHVLRPETFVGRTGKFGNLIALPARGALLSLAIDAIPAVVTIESLFELAALSHRDGPGSITPHLFWRTPEGVFHLQQGSCEPGRVRFVPSPEFLELLVRLQKARPGGGE